MSQGPSYFEILGFASMFILFSVVLAKIAGYIQYVSFSIRTLEDQVKSLCRFDSRNREKLEAHSDCIVELQERVFKIKHKENK